MILSVITSPDTYLLESIDPEPGLFWTSEIYGPKYSGYLARVFGSVGFFFQTFELYRLVSTHPYVYSNYTLMLRWPQ